MGTNVYDIITDRIVSLLAQGTVPWQQPWNSAQGMPKNLFSQRPYNGINLWLLGAQGYSTPFWSTFNQVKAAGGSVKRGERSTPVIFWKRYDGKETQTGEVEKRFVLRYYNVFNALQVEGIAVPVMEETHHDFTPIEICEKLVGNMPQRPAIVHDSTQAFYRPAADAVHMPAATLFESADRYYSTLFHELTHSTGHKDRLDRTTLKDAVRFGDPSYAREELVAEMGAAYLCGVCGIANLTIDQSAAYIAGWTQALRSDPRCVVTAAAQAQKAADFIQGLYQKEETVC